MLNAFKLIWNFSSKRKKEYRNAIIFSFLEGLFLMAKMFAVIIAIYALFGRYPISNAVIAVFALAVFYIVGVFIFSYKMQLTSMSAGFGMVGDKRFEFGEILKNAYLGFFDNFSVGRINSVLTTTLSEIETSAPSALIRVVGGVLGTVSLLIGLFFYEWRIALISLLGMAAYLFSSKLADPCVEKRCAEKKRSTEQTKCFCTSVSPRYQSDESVQLQKWGQTLKGCHSG